MSDASARRIPEGAEGSEELEALTDEILPALIARLRASRLGELEVSTGGWRVRLRRELADPGRTLGAAPGRRSSEAQPGPPEPGMARSPAVGYFSARRGLEVGQAVLAGDVLGAVDVLGIRQDVLAPIDGVVSRLLAEDDQAVEYGQVLVHVDALVPLRADEDHEVAALDAEGSGA